MTADGRLMSTSMYSRQVCIVVLMRVRGASRSGPALDQLDGKRLSQAARGNPLLRCYIGDLLCDEGIKDVLPAG